MSFRTRRARTLIMPSRPRGRHIWIRETTNLAAPNAVFNNIDLMQAWRLHQGGITINLPEITILRVKLRLSIRVTIAAAMNANDGILSTLFVDGISQVALNQFAQPFDQRDMRYEQDFLSHVPAEGGGNAAGTYFVERDFDIKARRKLQSVDDTLWLQCSATGQSVIQQLSYSHATLVRLGV